MGKFNFNGVKEYEWADVSLLFGGSPLVKFTGFEYGSDTEKEHLYAGGNKPIGIQSGNKKPAGSVTLLGTALDIVNAAAVAAGGEDITDIEFDVAFTYKPVGTRPVVSDVVKGCQVSGYKKGMQQGAKKMEVTLPFLCMDIATV